MFDANKSWEVSLKGNACNVSVHYNAYDKPDILNFHKYLMVKNFNFHPNEHIEGFCYYLFAVNLNRCMGSCNPLKDPSNGIEYVFQIKQKI